MKINFLNLGGHLSLNILTSICEEILYGKFPKITEPFSIIFSKSNFNISEL